MALASSLLTSARLGSLRLSSGRLAVPISCHSYRSTRLFSILQSSSPIPRSAALRHLIQSRSYTNSSPEQTPPVPQESVEPTLPDAEATTTVSIPEPSSVAVDGVSSSDIVDQTSGFSDVFDTAMSHLPPALQYGDLAALGLVSWTPAGLIRWTYELINVSTGLPWFWTIVAGSLLWKVALAPLSVIGLRNSARLLPLQPQIIAAQEEMKRVRASGDRLALQKQALKMRKMYNDAGVNMGATALTPFVQIPVTLGMFFGVKGLCSLPVEQLKYSGLDILPDLTVADPYMILPLALCAAINVQISVGASELNLKERPEMGHIMNGLRILSFLGVFIMNSFPSGLMVSLLVTSLATTAQSLAFQHPPTRRALGIPAVAPEMRGRLPSPTQTVTYVIEMWKRKVAEASAEQQRGKKRR